MIFGALLSAIGSLMPERLRARLGLEASLPLDTFTWITGLLELVGAAAIGWTTSMAYQGTRGITDVGVAFSGGERWLHLLLHTPLGLVIPYLAIEGAVRLGAGLAGATCGVLPLWLVDRVLHGTARGVQRAVARAPLVDRVEKLAAGYRIHASHDHGWGGLTTIDVHGVPHRVAEWAVDQPGERPFVWVLAPVPTGWLDRQIVRYDPHALLREARGAPARKTAAGVASMARELTQQAPTREDLIGGTAALLIGPFLALMPERIREHPRLVGVPVGMFTLLTGLVEMAVGMLAWLIFMPRFGVAGVPTLLALFVTLEGTVRASVGWSGAGCGLTIAWAIDRLLHPRAASARVLPPLIDDLRAHEDGTREIRSCRRRGWPAGTRLGIDGAVFVVVREQEDPGELRPWIYRLEPTAATGPARDYRPEQIVEEADPLAARAVS